jgi:phage gpG-like protein
VSGAGIHIDVSVAGSEPALQRIAEIYARLDRPRPMWEQMGEYGVMSTQRRFERGIDPDGNPWPPSYRALTEGGLTLVDSARLMHSQTYIASDAGVEWGTNAVYAAIHQFSGTINMPARTQTTFHRYDAKSDELSGFVKKGRANVAFDHAVEAHTIHMPRRAFIGLDDDDDVELVNIAESFIAPAGSGVDRQ